MLKISLFYLIDVPESLTGDSGRNKQHLLVSEIARYHCDQEDYTDAADILEEFGRFDESIQLHIAVADWTKAGVALSTLPTGNQEQLDYKWICSKAIELFSNDETWFDLDSAERDTLHAMIDPETYGGFMAEGIEALIEYRDFRWPEPTFDTSYHGDSTSGAKYAGSHPMPIGNREQSKNMLNENKDLFSVYPNPTNGNFTLLCKEAGILVIASIEGREIKRYDIATGKNELVLPNTLSKGIYIGRFTENKNNKSHIIRLMYNND